MRILFLDVEGILITSNGEQVTPIEGVNDALNFHASQRYELIGLSSQGLLPAHKRVDEELMQMMATVKLYPQLSCIYVAPGVGDVALVITEKSTDKYPKPDNIKSFVKPEVGLIQLALLQRGKKKSIWLIGDSLLDKQQAKNANIEFLNASLWHQHFSSGIKQVNHLSKEQLELLEGVKPT